MLELSKKILDNGQTMFLKLNKSLGLQGTYFTYFKDGICPDKLPESELTPIRLLSNLMEELKKGATIQFHKSDYMIDSLIGYEKSEGIFNEIKYLEIYHRFRGYDYHQLLIDIDIKLAESKENITSDVKEYKKLYKGDSKYE